MIDDSSPGRRTIDPSLNVMQVVFLDQLVDQNEDEAQ